MSCVCVPCSTTTPRFTTAMLSEFTTVPSRWAMTCWVEWMEVFNWIDRIESIVVSSRWLPNG